MFVMKDKNKIPSLNQTVRSQKSLEQGPRSLKNDLSSHESSAPEKGNVLREQKYQKLKSLEKENINPYPHHFEKTHKCKDVVKQCESLKPGESLLGKDKTFKTAGRIMRVRGMGKASFFNIQDESGDLQCYLNIKNVDKVSGKAFSLSDIGDIVAVTGEGFRTKKGEPSLRCLHFRILTKSLEPLPEKYHGLENQELKYRKPYLKFIMDPNARKIFYTRSKIVKAIRAYLDQKGFLEVETPVLQPIYGGAEARPFSTFHHSLNHPFYLKISPELYLKRLIVGGFEKVYELNKSFRNEGIDSSHNPEFTMLEYYEAYTDYIYQMKQFEDLVCHVVGTVKQTLKIAYQGKSMDFTPPWERLTLVQAIKKYGNLEIPNLSLKDMYQWLKQNAGPGWSLIKSSPQKNRETGKNVSIEPVTEQNLVPFKGQLIMDIFEHVAEKHLWNPVFIIDFPEDISPLTKSHREKKGLVERFEPYVAGLELGNAYTELNNPVDQKERLKEQEAKRQLNGEAHPMDLDFVKALEVGMPPTGGVGLGVERLVTLLTDQRSIKDVIMFPTLKPEKL